MTDLSGVPDGTTSLPRLYEHLVTAALEAVAGREHGTQLDLEALDLADSHQRLARHVGSRPMNITWRMETAIPGTFLAEYARLTA